MASGQCIGVLTSGGDCPGLNAAIRGLGKAAIDQFEMSVIGFRDGFRGLALDRIVRITGDQLSGILTDGGTFLGASRDKPHKMPIGERTEDMTDAIVATYQRHGLDCVVCIGGGGTQKNALRLQDAGLNVVSLPKTIDNDIAKTDVSFGFDTALGIATEAIDRLHSTATSHHRIIVVELMGHRAGWLALGAGIAGGADVILIPEIPYAIEHVAEAINARARRGKRFSIVAVAEGTMTVEQSKTINELAAAKSSAETKDDKKKASQQLAAFHHEHVDHTLKLTHQLEEMTGLESRLTILGHLQRGGTPSAADRLLATRLGATCAELLHEKQYGYMVAARGDGSEAVPIEEVAGSKKLVPADHPWVRAARSVGTSLGDS
ncbi:6-phosphofructokinase [Posidoniimonas polymericola]|uniref:ATP-dependent 6-phosphofructokinase n=1 Tax=Posidoniimonas polymericola TaxID=2528002 RepID=A0A5C5ZEK9_9BACT|nr:ATP-dependent 6-phosphofructokinase [Posidoniimonas polymericola]TWT85281.1 6-phosphofructokinase [Posidoniimonas polymericola]